MRPWGRSRAPLWAASCASRPLHLRRGDAPFQTGNSTLSFKVALSAPSDLPVTLDYATASRRFSHARFPGGRVTLIGGKFGICVSKQPWQTAAHPQRSTRKRSRCGLWGHGKGRFQTGGRYSAGTVRGTTWETLDRCDGTVTVVRTGVVDVYDFVLKKHVRVPAGSSYLASPSQKP